MPERVPKITWGASYANTLEIPFFDNPIDRPEPRAGSEQDQGSSGIEESWLVGVDQLLDGEVRFIPTTDTADPLASGWDGTTGWAAFLEWAWQKNKVRWFPDRTSGTYIECYLVEPWVGWQPSREPADGLNALHLVLRIAETAPAGTRFTGY